MKKPPQMRPKEESRHGDVPHRDEGPGSNLLEEMETIVTLTEGGDVTLLRDAGSAENLVLALLVAQHCAYRSGKTKKQSLSVDELIAAAGLAQRVARQTVYNTTSTLSRAKIIQKTGNEFFVDERTVIQFRSALLSDLVKDGSLRRSS